MTLRISFIDSVTECHAWQTAMLGTFGGMQPTQSGNSGRCSAADAWKASSFADNTRLAPTSPTLHALPNAWSSRRMEASTASQLPTSAERRGCRAAAGGLSDSGIMRFEITRNTLRRRSYRHCGIGQTANDCAARPHPARLRTPTSPASGRGGFCGSVRAPTSAACGRGGRRRLSCP